MYKKKRMIFNSKSQTNFLTYIDILRYVRLYDKSISSVQQTFQNNQLCANKQKL
jgi:hypothetical protein